MNRFESLSEVSAKMQRRANEPAVALHIFDSFTTWSWKQESPHLFETFWMNTEEREEMRLLY